MASTHTVKKAILKLIPHKTVRFILKHFSINFIFFGKAQKNIGSYLLKDCKAEFNCYGMEEELGPEVVKGFKMRFEDYKNHKGLLCEYILQCENCVIEPCYGWGITEKDQLIFDSIANNAWIESYCPSYLDYKKNKTRAIYYPEIISVRLLKGGENNYWHFLHDLLGQVMLARQNNLHAPILITKSLSEKSYFKAALQKSSILAATNWIIQDQQYIRAGKAWFLQTKPNSMKQFWAVLDLLEVKDSDSTANRKIFLTRNRSRIRFLNNAAVIEKIARQYDFEIIDADKLSFAEQIVLFGQTSHLIGIHGAGLTNVMFRKNAPLFVFELLPADYIEPHYFWLSKGMGHQYICQVGSLSAIDTSFKIDAHEFEMHLRKMLVL